MRLHLHRSLSAVAVVVLTTCGGWALAGSASAEGCANEQLRAEQPYGLELPDCRAYEMVSPLDKNDNDAIVAGGGEMEDRASVTGEAIVYDSAGSFANSPGYLLENYISSRGPGGWSTRSPSLPLISSGNANGVGELAAPYWELAFTPDLSAGITTADVPLTSGAVAGYEELYLADLRNGSYQLVSPNIREGAPYEFGEKKPWLMGASADLSHVAYENNESTEDPMAYESVDGEVFPVSVANDGEAMLGSIGSGDPKGSSAMEESYIWHAMSSDGSRIFFTSPTGDHQQDRELYVRENAEQPQSPVNGEGQCTVPADACTVQISASQRKEPDPNGPSPMFFQGASADGSRVFFTSREELTEEANTGPADSAANLYEYDFQAPAGERLTDLSVDGRDPNGAAVLGVMKISEDGSYVYFVAEGVLTNGKSPDGSEPVEGQANLYVSHDGGAPAFIATLVQGVEGRPENDEEDWSDGQAGNQTALSNDGTRLAFLSERSLTGYDNEAVEQGECIDHNFLNSSEYAPGPCKEVYLYAATAGSLTCVSCNPTGAPPVGESGLNQAPNSQTKLYLPRNFSEDGSRLFFESADALVAHDSNGLRDVYEYEGGHLHALSDDAGSRESFFVDASGSGDDVFIATGDQLLPQDTDHYVDVYDVRVDGGFPVSVSPPACDNGDSCKGPATPQPGVFGAPASATFSGAGNIVPAPAVVQPKPDHEAAKPKKTTKCMAGGKPSDGKCVKEKRKGRARHAERPAKGRK